MSIGNWRGCIAFTLTEEGGLVDEPGDPGGLTNFGISQAAYPGLDIRALTRAGAEDIYARDYWRAVRGDDLPPGVDLMVFDEAVNAGVGMSAEILQRCLGVTADGVIGTEETVPAVRATEPVGLIKALGAAQLAHYQSLMGWAEFGAGWAGRVTRRQAAALEMARAAAPTTLAQAAGRAARNG